MTAYYNEFDPFAAAWLRELIKAGHIAPGDVDERSILEVKADDLKGYTQWHFFAGIGGWSLALRMAGWGDDRQVMTGSAPCQPFSSAGNQKGQSDERHLLPVWMNLIKDLQPATVFGEQVASAINIGVNDEEMFCMLNRETPVGVQEIWRQVKGWSSASLQAMSARVREEVALSVSGIPQMPASETQGVGQTLSREVDREKQSSIFDFFSEAALPEKGNTVRLASSRGRYISANFIDAMRDYWTSTQGKAREAGLQQSFYRQDQTEQGVRLQQYTDSLLRNKRGDGELGAGEIRNHHQTLEGILNDLRGIAAKAGTKFTGKIAHGWLDDVYQGLEAEGYAVGSAVLPACSVGAPHKRDRLWFVAHSESQRRNGAESTSGTTGGHGIEAGRCDVADAMRAERRPPTEGGHEFDREDTGREKATSGHSVYSPQFWVGGEWNQCTDGKSRKVGPSISLLANGVSNRVGKLRGYGNAIVAPLAAEFIKATM